MGCWGRVGVWGCPCWGIGVSRCYWGVVEVLGCCRDGVSGCWGVGVSERCWGVGVLLGVSGCCWGVGVLSGCCWGVIVLGCVGPWGCRGAVGSVGAVLGCWGVGPSWGTVGPSWGAVGPPWGAAGRPHTRSRLVRSNTSTNFSSRVRAVKMKSSSTHRTYLVLTWETARFRPANQPCATGQPRSRAAQRGPAPYSPRPTQPPPHITAPAP